MKTQVRIVADIIKDGVVVETRSVFRLVSGTSEYDADFAEAAGDLIGAFADNGDPSFAIFIMLQELAASGRFRPGDGYGRILDELGRASERWGLTNSFNDAVKLVIDEAKLVEGGEYEADPSSAPDTTPDTIATPTNPANSR